jgi:uncharacterized protein (UPF0335 family)
VTDYTELKRLLSAQISLHQIATKTETVEDENTYLDADGALNDYLTEQDLFIEEIALSALTENTRLESEAVYAAAGFDAARDEIERLKAENETLRQAIQDITAEVDGNIRPTVRDCVNGQNNIQDIHGYCDQIESIAAAAMKEPQP